MIFSFFLKKKEFIHITGCKSSSREVRAGIQAGVEAKIMVENRFLALSLACLAHFSNSSQLDLEPAQQEGNNGWYWKPS